MPYCVSQTETRNKTPVADHSRESDLFGELLTDELAVTASSLGCNAMQC